MKGLAFHWEPPFRDVYSGMDPFADAWTDLAQAFELELAVICPDFPPPHTLRECAYTSLDAFLAYAGAKVAFADVNLKGDAVDLRIVDWLVIGTATGWEPPNHYPKWRYDPSPGGGWHPLHLAHLACASTR